MPSEPAANHDPDARLAPFINEGALGRIGFQDDDAMSDAGSLPFDADGYLDLSGFPDGDPDTVLDASSFETLREAVSGDLDADLDGGVDLTFIESAADGVRDVDLSDLLPEQGAEGTAGDAGGPFDLSEYEGHLGDDTDLDVAFGGGGGPDGGAEASTVEDVAFDEAHDEDGFGDGTYDEVMGVTFEDAIGPEGQEAFVVDQAELGWDEGEAPIEPDPFEGTKDDEWGNG